MAALVAGALTCAPAANAAARPPAPHHASAPHHGSPRHSGSKRAVPQRPETPAAPAAAAALSQDGFVGGAFDTCAAPTAAAMAAWWGASAFKAAGIYLGGVNRACPQGNLSASWVQQVSAQGWRLIPAYVGLQAPCVTAKHLNLMVAAGVQAEATAAADDAAADAVSLGLAPGSAIYYDLENYQHGNAACTQTVMAYISTWTQRLHTDGYLAGVYSSADSGIADLGRAVGSPGWVPPDSIWIARWNNSPSTSDPSLPDTDWADHQRIKQFTGSHQEAYGSASIEIDGNYVDGPVAIVAAQS